MSKIHVCSPPDNALLSRYSAAGAYTDAYCVEIDQAVSQSAFVEAFYTGRVFKLERLLLRWFLARPSTDKEAREVARGEREEFSAWSVEARESDQLLMCDIGGRTRSWFMVLPIERGTRLYFGSAVVPVRQRSGRLGMGWLFRILLGFHRIYSRLLLGAASARLRRPASQRQ